MKKLKSLKTLSSLGAIAAITPIVATSCSSDDSTSDKINVNSFDWKENGQYNSAMNAESMVKEFKANNPAGVDDIPSDIYENVNVVANGSSTHWTINIKPNNTTTKYKGSKTIELKVKVGIGSFTWIEQGNYYKTMLREQIIAEFIINNPTTSGDIPSDIYDAININAIQGTNGWEIILSTKTSSPIYGGSLSFYVYTTAQPVNTIDWSPYGTYIATMTDESMTAEFINNNPAGSNGIPADIYDHVEVNAVGEGVNRIIEVHPKSGDLLYRDNCKVSVIMMGILVCGNKQYILPEDIDINRFCGGKGTTLVIPTKGEGHQNIKSEDITQLYLSTKCNVEEIQPNFLSNCTNLTTLSLSGFGNVKTIGNNFLSGCTGLTSLNLYDFNSVTEINDSFLTGCSNLTSIDMSCFDNLEIIGNKFASGCIKLVNLNLENVTKVEEVGEDFASNCGLITLSLVDFKTSLAYIGNNFFKGCTALETVTTIDEQDPLDPGFRALVEVGNSFFDGCSALTSMELTKLNNIIRLGSNFFNGCSSLTSLSLENLISINTINNNFLSGCSKLTSIDIGTLINVRTIKDNFLQNCSSIQEINFIGFTDLRTIGNYFLSGCSSLASLDFTNVTNVETIGTYFLDGCKGLLSIDFAGFEKINSVGSNFLNGFGDSWKLNKIILPEEYHVGFAKAFSSLAKANHWYGTNQNSGKFIIPAETINLYAHDWGYNDTDIQRHIVEKGKGYISLKSTYTYTLIDDFNVEKVCGQGDLNIPTVAGPITVAANNHADIVDFYFPDDVEVSLIPDSFLYNCSGLQTINLKNMTTARVISNNFLYGCSNLASINISGFTQVVNIGANFMYGCSKLPTFETKGFENVKTIGTGFLSKCTGLTSIDTSGFVNLEIIKDDFMSGCNNAKFLSIRFEDVTKLKSIGNNFLKGNSELLEIKLDKCTALEKIGSGFIEDCSRLIQFYAPYKNPSDMTVDEYGFMTNVTRSCEIHVGKDNVEAYKETYPWNIRYYYITE